VRAAPLNGGWSVSAPYSCADAYLGAPVEMLLELVWCGGSLDGRSVALGFFFFAST
jgi:hypothetical protein